MSHFTVGVILKDINKLKDILEPFNENIEVPEYVEYTKEQLIAKSKKEIEDYKNGIYAEYLNDVKSYEEKYKENEGHIDYLKNEFPLKLKWSDEEHYQNEIKWVDKENIGPQGEMISTYNPKSKWDWWVLGGRWKDDIRFKNGGRGDWGLIKDIDFSLDQTIYDKSIRYWEVVVEKQLLKEHENEKDFSSYYKESYYIDQYGTKENYARIHATFRTFALITLDGEWHEKGKMGWFGIDDSTKESQELYLDFFQKEMSKEENQDCYLAVVDCHI